MEELARHPIASSSAREARPDFRPERDRLASPVAWLLREGRLDRGTVEIALFRIAEPRFMALPRLPFFVVLARSLSFLTSSCATSPIRASHSLIFHLQSLHQ